MQVEPAIQSLDQTATLTLGESARDLRSVANVSAVILDVGSRSALLPLSRHRAIHQFPVFGRSLLSCISQALAGARINRVAFVSGASVPPDASCWSPLGTPVQLVREARESGSAGVMRELDHWLGDNTCLLLTADVFVTAEDIALLLQVHQARDAGITALLAGDSQAALEGVNIDRHGRVLGFFGLHTSRERRQQLKPLGVYVVSPTARAAIPESGYFDLREQLIPALLSSQADVYACVASSSARRLNTLSDYRALMRVLYAAVESGHLDLVGFLGPTYRVVAPGVWSEEGASIADDVRMIGPVVMGRDCRLEPAAQLVGPVALGRGCTIHRGALVRDTLLWDGATVGEKARVVGCLVAPGSAVPAGSRELFKVIPGETADADLPHYFAEDAPLANQPVVSSRSARRYRLYLASKRAMDATLAGIGLLLCAPLCCVIALAIKLDSTGPVLFRQRRCGLGGREFPMRKFRTMVVNADQRRIGLVSLNEVDGPVFKMQDDPRMTRVGKFLRMTSLDELPQLINVLEGDMSLVGPRPLIMEEMRFPKHWRDARLTVKPGMTGLWQIEGRAGKAFHHWISHDLAYVERRSMRLDLSILLRTFASVFTSGRGM